MVLLRLSRYLKVGSEKGSCNTNKLSYRIKIFYQQLWQLGIPCKHVHTTLPIQRHAHTTTNANPQTHAQTHTYTNKSTAKAKSLAAIKTVTPT